MKPNQDSTFLGVVCAPLAKGITQKAFFGGDYVLPIDLLRAESTAHQLGAVLCRARRHDLKELTNLIFVCDAKGDNISETTAKCERDARRNLEEFKDQFEREPTTFDDFILYRGIAKRLGQAQIQLDSRDAYNAYVAGDKRMRSIFEEKVDPSWIGKDLLILALQGVFFGASFPDTTETMCKKASLGEGKPSMEEAEAMLLGAAARYAAEHCPEVIDPLGLSIFLRPGDSPAT